MKSFGPLTHAIDILFRTVDHKLRNAYQQTFQQLDSGESIFFTTEKKSEELFPLQAILVNTLTEPHIDRDDWVGGWAWIAPFGSFSKGDLCLPQLGIRVPLAPGAIAGLRGRELVHFTDKWVGSRYSIVHFFKDSIRVQKANLMDTAEKKRKEVQFNVSSAQMRAQRWRTAANMAALIGLSSVVVALIREH
ncbi:MAG: hypothetical protein M1839_004163 [Geoglossum umbratile]|nr:MAG: hypothetical protein M1839_004163 [Geoglossum umbratile]